MSQNQQNIPELNLGSQEKVLIAQTWNDDFDAMFDVALDIYEEFFKRVPPAANLFPSVDTKTLEIRQNAKFQKMSLRLVRILSLAVRHLHDLSQMDAILLKTGRGNLSLGTSRKWPEASLC